MHLKYFWAVERLALVGVRYWSISLNYFMLVTHSNVYNFCFITKIVESKSRTRLTGSWENARSDIFSVLDALNASYATRKYSLFRFLSTKFNFHGGHRRPKILTKNHPGDFRTFCARRCWSVSLYYFILVTHSNLHNFCFIT